MKGKGKGVEAGWVGKGEGKGKREWDKGVGEWKRDGMGVRREREGGMEVGW